MRDSSDTDSSIDVSRLLYETRDNGVVDILLERANELVREVEAELPDLTTGSESSYEVNGEIFHESSDSGNSEVRWGFANMNTVNREGGHSQDFEFHHVYPSYQSQTDSLGSVVCDSGDVQALCLIS